MLRVVAPSLIMGTAGLFGYAPPLRKSSGGGRKRGGDAIASAARAILDSCRTALYAVANVRYHRGDEVLVWLHLARKFIGRVRGRIYGAAQPSLGFAKRARHVGEPNVADDHQVHIVGGMLLRSCHRTVDESPSYSVCQRL